LFKKLAFIICVLFLLTNIAYASSVYENTPAPENLTAELASFSDGSPYFKISFDIPASIKDLVNKEYQDNEAGAFYSIEFEYKIGDKNWYAGGNAFSAEAWQDAKLTPEDMGIDGNIDIKANTYNIRAKFVCNTFTVNADGVRMAGSSYHSPYSNVFSIGTAAFQKYKNASTWAETELDKAAEYGFITDRIKDKMNGPITREEFCEVVIKLYEKKMGNAAIYSNMNAFTDTKNPEIFKAYELGIVNGVGGNKFAPNDLVNREQVAAMMHRAVKTINPAADFSTTGVEKFADEHLISSWALESLKFMNKNGFIKGVGDNRVDPKGTTTREQAVIMVLRTYEAYQ